MTHVKIMSSRWWVGIALLAMLSCVTSCNKSEKPAATQAVQKTFTSPDDAAKSLVEAAKAGNHDALVAIFGPGSQDIIFSGDAEQDKAAFENFTAGLYHDESLAQADRWRRSARCRSRQ